MQPFYDNNLVVLSNSVKTLQHKHSWWHVILYPGVNRGDLMHAVLCTERFEVLTSSRTTIWSHWAAVLRRCATKTEVRPCARVSRAPSICFSVRVSRALVASSHSKTTGFCKPNRAYNIYANTTGGHAGPDCRVCFPVLSVLCLLMPYTAE